MMLSALLLLGCCFASQSYMAESFSQQQQRVPWNAVRFLQQSSKFVRLFPTRSQRRILQPSDSLPFSQMAPLDDVVMGGASASSFDSSTSIWKGTVTDANNGGFIGIRSSNSFVWDATQCTGLEWEIENVDRRPFQLKFVVRDSTDFNGVTWTTIAKVQPGRTNRVRVPFQQLVGARFAKRLDDKGGKVAFNAANIVGVQITYSKFEYDGQLNPTFQAGELMLKIKSLKTY